jgi:uncharacterized membrane protein YccC
MGPAPGRRKVELLSLLLRWLRTRDAGLSALRRAGRTAIVMPALFALGARVLDNPTLATFAAFGSFAMLLLADFGGSMRDRLAAQASLVLVGAALVCLGTLVSRSAWLATPAMVLVGFAVLFSGVVSSVLAAATTSVLLAFILPVTLPGPVGSIPDRLSGWLLAGAASLVAIGLLWPAPAREPLRDAAAKACRLLAVRLRLEVASADPAADPAAAAEAASAAVGAMRDTFFATPYRPTGLTTAARTVVRLVDEIVWLEVILRRSAGAAADPPVRAVKSAAATLLEHVAKELGAEPDPQDSLEAHVRELAAARDAMERASTTRLPVSSMGTAEFVSSLEPSFQAQEMSFAITAIAQNTEATVAAQRRGWWQQVLGRQPEGVDGRLASAQQRAGAHVERHSVWLHNSVRGAIGLGGAVLIADLTGVQHSFWIVLGTLSVLRSNALTTGQNVVRALLGTTAGFAIGGALVVAIGTNTTVLWLLLPAAILFAGLAPAVISFAAGQAGFTITLLILFNIISPAGWQVGLVRIEDVAVGCAVSLLVGVLFWPRGAATALAQAFAEAYADAAAFLRAAVEAGARTCAGLPVPAGGEGERAAAAARRLDDAFRNFLAERGTKHLPLAEVAALITGVAGLRLTAAAVLDLWSHEGSAVPAGDRTPARTELTAAAGRVAGWYDGMAAALAGAGEVPDPLPSDKGADGRLIEAVRHDLAGPDGAGTAVAVRMIWTGDHIDAARRLQEGLVAPARAAASYRGRRAWLSGPRTTPATPHRRATAAATS